MIDIEYLLPNDMPEYMIPAWIGCICLAVDNQNILERFRSETGNNYEPSSIPIERAIDEACSVDRDVIIAFVKWFNANLWGPINGPDAQANEN